MTGGSLRCPRLALGGLLCLVSLGCAEPSQPVAQCERRSDCPLGYACDPIQKSCVAESACDDDADCCPGLTCLSGGCRLLDDCAADADCVADDAVCDRGRCVPRPCSHHTDCPGAMNYCMAGRCLPGLPCSGCPEGTVCDPIFSRCFERTPACDAVECGVGTVRVVDNTEALRGLGLACSPEMITCACAQLPPLPPATPGPWLTVLTVAGVDWVVARDVRYGDLVAQPLGGDQTLVLDGVPDGPVTGDPLGPRGGVAAPGRDVGRFAAAATDGERLFALARDSDAGTLRFVLVEGGSKVAAYDLDAEVSSGYGAALTYGEDGRLHAAWFTLSSDGVASLRHGWTRDDEPLSSPGAWVREVVQLGPVAPAFANPCLEPACSPLEVCINGDAGPHCAITDLVPECDPPCHRGAICVAGSCREQLRRSLGMRAWDELPGSQTTIATRGADVLVGWYDQPQGALRLAVDSGDGFVATRVDGGTGADVGRSPRLAVHPTGAVALIYRDVSRDRLRLLYGPDPLSLLPETLGRGGLGGSVAFTPDGRVVVAHGSPEGDRLELVWGNPGAWQSFFVPLEGQIGRFNAVQVIDTEVRVLTIRDTLSLALEPQPAVVWASILLQ